MVWWKAVWYDGNARILELDILDLNSSLAFTYVTLAKLLKFSSLMHWLEIITIIIIVIIELLLLLHRQGSAAHCFNCQYVLGHIHPSKCYGGWWVSALPYCLFHSKCLKYKCQFLLSKFNSIIKGHPFVNYFYSFVVLTVCLPFSNIISHDFHQGNKD